MKKKSEANERRKEPSEGRRGEETKMNQIRMTKFPELPYAVEEAVNRLRINVSFLGNDIRTIMVVSTMPNEGKSFVTMQLWRQMAEAGIQTILVDMDLRKSITAEKYGIETTSGEELKGTSYYLAHGIALEEAVCRTEFTCGDLLPNVDNVVNPSMLLESKRFEQMLEEMKAKYRYVLVDSPPLNLVSDGERIGNLCDGAILVVRGGTTPKGMVKHSLMQLERAGCPLLGVVLNRVEGAKSGYYYKRYGGRYYGYGYGYGNEYYYGK